MNPKLKRGLIHSSLFIVTFITTTIAGAQWTNGSTDFVSGLPYSICFLTILSFHEFGHYFTARYHRIETTLPFYLPLPPSFPLLGTLGALIRIKGIVRSTKEHFDIGISGPLAGFAVSLGFLIYGFMTLPPADVVFDFHPEYKKYGANYADYVYKKENMPENVLDIFIGKNLIYSTLEAIFADTERAPNGHEIMHYPFLFAGFLSLVFTCINLLPIGQLDGGHVLYGLVGSKWHTRIATTFFLAFIFYAGLGLISPFEPFDDLLYEIPFYLIALYAMFRSISHKQSDRVLYALGMFAVQYLVAWIFPGVHGYSGWLLFAFVIGTFIGVRHPISEIEEPLDLKRKILGWLALLIFVLCFTPQPIT